MTEWNKNNTIFIMASTGFLYEGSLGEGFKVYHPYIGKSFFARILREIFYRCSFLPKRIWYNKKILKEQPRYIVVWDPLITVDFLMWLLEVFPSAQINFRYGNMVGKANHLIPNKIPKGIRIWTYDNYDSKKYGIYLSRSHMYFKTFIKSKQNLEYDVFFIGKDKGRGEYLLDLEKDMKSLGLVTKFIITADGKLSKKKYYYQREIPYSRVVEYCTKSRAILNVVMEDQQGVTLRDLEAIFFNTKLITTNKYIVNSEFYNPRNVFIIGEQDIKKLPEFLSTDQIPIDISLLKKYSIAGMLDEITRSDIQGE